MLLLHAHMYIPVFLEGNVLCTQTSPPRCAICPPLPRPLPGLARAQSHPHPLPHPGCLGAYCLRESRPLTHRHRGSTLPGTHCLLHLSPRWRRMSPHVPRSTAPSLPLCPWELTLPGHGHPQPFAQRAPSCALPRPCSCTQNLLPRDSSREAAPTTHSPPGHSAFLASTPVSLLPPSQAEAWDCSSHPLPPAPHLPAPRETGPSTVPKEMLLPLTQTLR